MGKGVLWAAVCLLMTAAFVNMTMMVLALVSFWPGSFVMNELNGIGIPVFWVFFAILFRFYAIHLGATGGIGSLIKPSTRAIVLRFLAACVICALSVGYNLALVYYWIVLPGVKTPFLLVMCMWLLSNFPMSFLMAKALRGVWYIGDVRKDDLILRIPKDKIGRFHEWIRQSAAEGALKEGGPIEDPEGASDKKPLLFDV